MKASEVMNVLHISRPSLHNYLKSGLLKANIMANGRYDYDRDSVLQFKNCNVERQTVCYARVSTAKQKSDLENQVNLLKQWCFSKGYALSAVYQDVASGISFSDRKEMMKMIDLIIENKVRRIVITYKDRLSRIGFEFFKILFEKYNAEIEVISEVGSTKLDSEEVFEEIVSLLHCYSMKLYSSRRKKTIQDLCQEEQS